MLKQNCFNCSNCRLVKIKESDYCDYAIYKCLEKNEIIDEFYVDFKRCQKFSWNEDYCPKIYINTYIKINKTLYYYKILFYVVLLSKFCKWEMLK